MKTLGLLVLLTLPALADTGVPGISVDVIFGCTLFTPDGASPPFDLEICRFGGTIFNNSRSTVFVDQGHPLTGLDVLPSGDSITEWPTFATLVPFPIPLNYLVTVDFFGRTALTGPEIVLVESIVNLNQSPQVPEPNFALVVVAWVAAFQLAVNFRTSQSGPTVRNLAIASGSWRRSSRNEVRFAPTSNFP